jgi:hypothetical protein
VNRWQVLRQMRYRCWSKVWPGSGGERVVATPIISPGMTVEELLGAVRAGPMVAFNAGDDQADEASGALGVAVIPVTIAVQMSNDRTGSGALVGSHGARLHSDGAYGQTSSQGRGLLEVEEVVLDAIRQGAGDIGLSMQARPVGAPMAGSVGGLGIAVREYRIEVRCMSARHYHPPQRLVATGNVLSWALPPDRFDRYKIVLRYASGATAPTGPTAGSPITLASDLATSVDVTGTLAAGTYSFALFAAYDETRDVVLGQTLSEAQRHSSQEVGSYRNSVAVT